MISMSGVRALRVLRSALHSRCRTAPRHRVLSTTAASERVKQLSHPPLSPPPPPSPPVHVHSTSCSHHHHPHPTVHLPRAPSLSAPLCVAGDVSPVPTVDDRVDASIISALSPASIASSLPPPSSSLTLSDAASLSPILPTSPASSSATPSPSPQGPDSHPTSQHTSHAHPAPSHPLPGWHQRPLPPSLVAFSSNRGRALFKSALSQHLLEGYFALAEQFTTQSEPAYCGPGTLAMVLNALRIDPRRIWKGNWRWFSEEMLETCDVRRVGRSALDGVEVNGLSFEELLFLAECNGAHVQAFRASHSSLSKFRTAVHAAASRTDIHLVASFSRAVMGQTGCGHYSPIAGYHPQTDMALVMDVARFKYPPYWAPVELLWRAIQDVDPLTGQGRGYYLMSRGDEPAPALENEGEAAYYTPLSSTCRIAVDKFAWSRLAEHFCSVLPAHLAQLNPATPYEVLVAVLRSLPVDVTAVFTVYTHDLNKRYTGAARAREEGERRQAEAEGGPFANYSTFLPRGSPHHHPHRVESHHALHPLLTEISSTPLFRLLSSSSSASSPSACPAPLSAAPTVSASSLSLDVSHPHSPPSASLNLIGGLGTVFEREAELELATLLLFACPSSIFSLLPVPLQAQIDGLRQYTGSALRDEVQNLRSQMGILAEVCSCVVAAEREGEKRVRLREELKLDKPTNETVVSEVTRVVRKEDEDREEQRADASAVLPMRWAAAVDTVLPRAPSTTAARHRFVAPAGVRARQQGQH